MCESQVSCAVNLGPTAGANASSNIATSNVSQLMKQLEEYLLGRLDEIENKVKNNSRSIFDFVDMAVLIGALANATDSQNKRDTPQYIDFVKSELLPSTETQSDVIATVFYCLMRCGLIHEMSLAQHNIPPSRQQIISGWSANVTHDKSTCGHWYQADGATKSVVFYAN